MTEINWLTSSACPTSTPISMTVGISTTTAITSRVRREARGELQPSSVRRRKYSGRARALKSPARKSAIRNGWIMVRKSAEIPTVIRRMTVLFTLS